MSQSLSTAKMLWRELGNIPVNENEEIDEIFTATNTIFFKEGTDVHEIWHWFEEYFNISVAEDLMGLRNNY